MSRWLVLVLVGLGLLAGLLPAGDVGTGAVPLAQQLSPTPRPSPQAPRPGPWPQARQALRQQAFATTNSDASGQPRPDLLRQGIASQLRMPVSTTVRRRAASAVGGAPVPGGAPLGSHWVGVGPKPLRIDPAPPNYPAGDTVLFQGTGPDSGEVVDVAIDPRGSADQVVYIATNGGGIWKTTDGGNTWRPTMDFMPTLSMGAVALDPANPDVVYAGTGNPFDGGQIGQLGVGIYKSIDGGQTWTQTGASVLSGTLINRIVLPASGVLVVATTTGLYRSVDGGQSFGSNAPAFNNGQPVRTGYVSGLALDTLTPSTVYAAISAQGLFRSTDGGATFPDSGNLFASLGSPVA